MNKIIDGDIKMRHKLTSDELLEHETTLISSVDSLKDMAVGLSKIAHYQMKLISEIKQLRSDAVGLENALVEIGNLGHVESKAVVDRTLEWHTFTK